MDDVNTTRLARFDDQITEALSSDRLDFFRETVAHYVRHHDVPEMDVAAALAVVMQGDQPLLLEPEPEPPARSFKDRDRDGGRDGGHGGAGDRPGRGPRKDRPRHGGGPMTTYRIAVGKRHKVQPRQIVGAIANEGGLGRGDFGHIDIRTDHSLVELPQQLPPGAWEKLKGTRISGKLIELREDTGAPKKHRKG